MSLIRQVISIIAGRDGRFDSGRVDDLRLAASEACVNAIESYPARLGGGGADRHELDAFDGVPGEGSDAGGSPEPETDPETNRVVVHVTESEDRLTVTVEDSGRGFDPAAIEQGALRADDHPASGPRGTPGPVQRGPRGERGRGVSLIRALVDDVTFISSHEGTSVTMTIRSGS